MNLLDYAHQLAEKAHTNQFRRDGETPYFNHVRDVAHRVRHEHEHIVITAWLHDVFEDSNTDLIELLKFPPNVRNAVIRLTKGSDEHYADYIKRIKYCPIASVVKKADILSNLADDPTDKQIIKYANALLILLSP